MSQTSTSHLLLTICAVSSFIPTDTQTQAVLLFDPFCLSSFSHFAQNRTTIPTRKEIRARLYLEPIGNKYRIRSRRGTSCTCCRQGAWAAFSEAPEGQLQSPGGDPGCKGPENSWVLENLYGKNEAGLLQSSTFYFYS